MRLRIALLAAMLSCFVSGGTAATNPPTMKLKFSSPSIAPSSQGFEDWLYSITQTSDGGFLAGGYAEIDEGGGDVERHASLVKLDPAMARQWELVFDRGFLPDVIETPNLFVAAGDTDSPPGNLLVVAVTKGASPIATRHTFSPSALGMGPDVKSVDAFSIRNVTDQNGNDLGYIIAGTAEHTSGQRFSSFLLRLNSNFTAQNFGGHPNGVQRLSAPAFAAPVCKTVRLTHSTSGALNGFIVAGTIPALDEDDVGDILVERLDLNGDEVAARIMNTSDVRSINPNIDNVFRQSLCSSVPSLTTFKALAWDVVEIGDSGDFAVAAQVNVTAVPSPAGCSNVRLTGYSYKDMMEVLLRFSPTLAPRSAKEVGRFSGIDFQTPMALMKDGFAIAGNDATLSNGIVKARVIKTNFAGDVIWTGDYLLPGDLNDCAFAMTRTTDGGIVVAGNNDLNGEDYFAFKISPNCILPPSGRVARYSFNDAARSALDSDFGNNATWFNGPKPVPAVVGSGLSFDGVDDYAEAPARSQNAIGTGDFTIMGWIRVSPADTSPDRSIVDKRDITRSSVTGYHIAMIRGVLWLQLADRGAGSGYSNFESTINVADGQWHFFAVTVQRASPTGIHWYADGVLVPTATANPTGRQKSLANGVPLRFGKRSATDPGFFKGTLDELEIFNRALTAQEVADTFGASTAGRCR